MRQTDPVFCLPLQLPLCLPSKILFPSGGTTANVALIPVCIQYPPNFSEKRRIQPF